MGNITVFIRYLGAQCTVSVHTLQFRSAHQYYQTAKYQLHRTTGDKDMLLLIFQIPNRWTNWSSRPHQTDVEIHWMLSDKIQKIDYLHHHWSDGADTLQFDSTEEYFETVEYEPERSTELWDIDGKVFWDLPFQWLDSSWNWCEMLTNCASEPSNGPISELRRSWELSWLWEHSISNPCDTLSTSKRV